MADPTRGVDDADGPCFGVVSARRACAAAMRLAGDGDALPGVELVFLTLAMGLLRPRPGDCCAPVVRGDRRTSECTILGGVLGVERQKDFKVKRCGMRFHPETG